MDNEIVSGTEAIVFNIQGFCLHDGPGIRTTVFLKGCNLRCRWCDNPESINPRPELGFMKALCNKCNKCLEVCPQKAIGLDNEGDIAIDRERCTACGRCIEVCYSKALVIYGQKMGVEQVFEQVRRDSIFYEGSNGGVTVSGGEPLRQAQIVTSFFELCRKHHIHTCIETAGNARPEALRKVLEVTDCVLYDLKHMDSAMHRKYTGRPNDLMLDNAKLVALSGVNILYRMPLIPGVNDDPQNIKATARFLQSLKSEVRIELMPYHRLGLVKYQALGKPYLLDGIEPAHPEHVKSIKQVFEEFGVQCLISV